MAAMDHSQSPRASALPREPASTQDHVHAAEVDRVADWIECLLSFIDVQRTHPWNRRGLDRMYRDLEAKTNSCLDKIGDIELTVAESFLLLEGRTVYPRARRPDSLPRSFFRDGLRAIVVRQGLEPDELRDFVDIVRRATDDDGLRESEDIVALLWEQSFRHIDYVHVPLEESESEVGAACCIGTIGAGDGGIPRPSDVPECEEKVDRSEPVEGRSDDWIVHGGTAQVVDEGSRARFGFTATEAANVLMVAGFDEVLPLRDQALEIISSILTEEDRPREFLESAAVIGRFVEQALIEGDVARANSLVARLQGIADAKITSRSEIRAAADQVVLGIGRPEFLGRMAPVLNAHPEIDPGELVSLLVRLGPSAAPILCDLLSELSAQKLRRAVCEALTISCKDDVEILIERLSDSRWYVVRNILYILGRIGHQGVERALGDALYHGDARVRREAVRALGGIYSPRSRAYLNSALRDPDKGVRIIVAQSIAARRDERAAQVLMVAIEATEFAGRDADERTAFFMALGQVGSDALVPRLERALTRGGPFASAEEGRREAASALAWIGTPAALAVLRRESRSASMPIRRAVQEALESVRSLPSRR